MTLCEQQNCGDLEDAHASFCLSSVAIIVQLWETLLVGKIKHERKYWEEN